MRTVVPVSARRACRGLAQPCSTQRRPARMAADEPALIARRKRLVADQALDNAIVKAVVRGKLLSPARRLRAVMHVRTVVSVSARRACRGLAQPCSTQRRPARMAADEPALIARRITRARRFGRYGSRRIMALLRAEGWRVNHKRVERLWRQEGRRVPRKPRRRAERPNPVWSDDCVRERTHDGRPLRLRTIVDEHTRACRSIAVARRRRSDGVLARRTALFVRHGSPSSRRSDHGPAFTATAVRSWLRRLGVPTLGIDPGSPWENGDGESFTGTLRDEGRNPEICTTRTEAQVRIERGRRAYHQVRTHSALGYRPPAPEALEIGRPHPTPWAVRRVPMLTSRVAQRSGAGHGRGAREALMAGRGLEEAQTLKGRQAGHDAARPSRGVLRGTARSRGA